MHAETAQASSEHRHTVLPGFVAVLLVPTPESSVKGSVLLFGAALAIPDLGGVAPTSSRPRPGSSRTIPSPASPCARRRRPTSSPTGAQRIRTVPKPGKSALGNVFRQVPVPAVTASLDEPSTRTRPYTESSLLFCRQSTIGEPTRRWSRGMSAVSNSQSPPQFPARLLTPTSSLFTALSTTAKASVAFVLLRRIARLPLQQAQRGYVSCVVVDVAGVAAAAA
jgi:hypothetical protein